MDTDWGGEEKAFAGVGVAEERSMGEKGGLFNALNNK